MPAMLEALTSVDERLQANVSVYGLPVALSMDSGSLVILLQHILDPAFATPAHGASPDGQVGREDVLPSAYNPSPLSDQFNLANTPPNAYVGLHS